MRAVIYNRYGGPEVLETVELPKPEAGKEDVVVRIAAFSVNNRDATVRSGGFKMLTGRRFPKLTGADFSGVVDSVGENVKGFKPGDEVFAYLDGLGDGASAEYLRVPASICARKPAALSHGQAAVLGCAYLTAWQALKDKTRLNQGRQKPETLVVYGASGGVGTAAIQVGAHLGASVVAVSGARNRDFCLGLGADTFLAYDEGSLLDVFPAADVFFQVYSKGGSRYDLAKKVLSSGGRFVCLIPNPLAAFAKLFSRPSFDFLIVKNNVAELELLAGLVASGDLKPVISQTFSLNDLPRAHEEIANGHTRGKLIVNVD